MAWGCLRYSWCNGGACCRRHMQVPSQGWLPKHVLVRNAADGRLIGGVPMYLKAHSLGEYVFDSSWAKYAEMLGIR